MTVESLHRTTRWLIFGSLWAMMITLIPCCTLWLFENSAVPDTWVDWLPPPVWGSSLLILPAIFGSLLLKVARRPLVSGLIGAVAYLPVLIPAGAAVWNVVRGGSWSLADSLSLIPAALHFGLVSATAVAFATRRGSSRLRSEDRYDTEP